MLGSRCRERGTNPLCPVDIEDPQPSIVAVIDVSHQLVLCTITAVGYISEYCLTYYTHTYMYVRVSA